MKVLIHKGKENIRGFSSGQGCLTKCSKVECNQPRRRLNLRHRRGRCRQKMSESSQRLSTQGQQEGRRGAETGVGKSFYTEGWDTGPHEAPYSLATSPLPAAEDQGASVAPGSGTRIRAEGQGERKGQVSGQDSESPGSFLFLVPRKPTGRLPGSGIVSHSGGEQMTHLWRN